MQVAKLFLQTRWSLTIGNLLLVDNESQMTECILCITSDPAHNLSGENRCKVSIKSSNWWPFLTAHTSVVFLHEQWKWLWLFWVVKEIIILFVIKKIKKKYVNKDQRSRQYPTKLICILYTYMYIYLWMYPLTTIVEIVFFVKIPKSWIVRASWGLHPKPSPQVDR